jgi:hypothetical protein
VLSVKLPIDIGATSPDPHLPDLGPGMGQERDQALDADAQAPIRRPDESAEPTPGEQQAAADVATSIEEARARSATVTAGVAVDPAVLLHDPLEDLDLTRLP